MTNVIFESHLHNIHLESNLIFCPVCLSKAPEKVRARKAIFRSFVSRNGAEYTNETSCKKLISVHLHNIRMKEFCKGKVRDFDMALRAREVSGAFEKQSPGVN